VTLLRKAKAEKQAKYIVSTQHGLMARLPQDLTPFARCRCEGDIFMTFLLHFWTSRVCYGKNPHITWLSA
jgi:hypothetical protein